MRIKSFQIRAVAPIQLVQVEDVADIVVFAGPNGVGKTSIGTALLNLARNPAVNTNVWMIVEATNDEERENGQGDPRHSRNRRPALCRPSQFYKVEKRSRDGHPMAQQITHPNYPDPGRPVFSSASSR